MKTLKDELYIDIKAYKFTTFVILRVFCIVIYCVFTLSLDTYRVYQLYDIN